MPGLLTLRPLASAAKAAKGAAAKTAAVGAVRAEKVRDDARTQGQGKAPSPTFARARVVRAPALHRTVPAAPPPVPHPGGYQQDHHHHKQAGAPAQAQTQQGAAAVGRSSTTTIANHVADPAAAMKENCKRHGLEISKRIEGADYSSSGSEHEPNSVCLAEMVFDYIEEDLEVGKCGRARCNCGNSCSGGDSSLVNENDDSRSSLGGEMADVLLGLTSCASPCERIIHASATSALKALEGDDGDLEGEDDKSGHESARSSSMRRSVMTALRFSGYNAAICKSRWEHAGGFPGGEYEYIDVILEAAGIGKSERILVDIEFKAQFEIARPTSMYSSLLQSLPPIFVGKVDRLQQIVNIMCDAAKQSLKKKGMHLPPWRKPEYIKAKWFSAYRRTTNGTPASSGKSQERTNQFAQIALRGSGWDSKFTSEMEKNYLKAADRRLAIRDCNGWGTRVTMTSFLQRKHEDEPEGKVRGANRMGPLGLNGDHSIAATGEYDITSGITEWEPPAVIPRTSTQKAAVGKVGGLVSILKESGLKQEEVQRKELQELTSTIAVNHRQQAASALSKPMAVV